LAELSGKPRNSVDTLFPVTTVGSWPRPVSVIQGLRQLQAGEMTKGDFDRIADVAVPEAHSSRLRNLLLVARDGAARSTSLLVNWKRGSKS
jgi:methionine synthase II (cobalamin-independent)